LGVIAGTCDYLPIISRLFQLPIPNDGKVSVESSKVEGMADHVDLPVTHSFMMNNPLVITQTLTFLKHSRFY